MSEQTAENPLGKPSAQGTMAGTMPRKSPPEDPRLPQETVNHPAHYGGADNPYEAIKVIEAWNLGFCLGNTIKYISRCGKKGDSRANDIEDLKKARWYLDRQIANMEHYSRG